MFFRNTVGELVKELAGDVCCMGTGGMKRNGNAFIDGSLELGKVGNGGIEDLVAEGLAYLPQVGKLERTRPLELGNDVTQELESGVVVPLHPLDDRPNAGRAAGSPVGRLQRDDDKIRSTKRRVAGQRHPRRTIQEDVVVIGQKLGHGVGQGGMEPLAFPLAGLRKV